MLNIGVLILSQILEISSVILECYNSIHLLSGFYLNLETLIVHIVKCLNHYLPKY